MSCRDDAIKAVDGEWRTAADIHERAGVWSIAGIRHALDKLSSDLVIQVMQEPGKFGVLNKYRLPKQE